MFLSNVFHSFMFTTAKERLSHTYKDQQMEDKNTIFFHGSKIPIKYAS